MKDLVVKIQCLLLALLLGALLSAKAINQTGVQVSPNQFNINKPNLMNRALNTSRTPVNPSSLVDPLTRLEWDPFTEMTQMRKTMNTMFNSMDKHFKQDLKADFIEPRIEVKENSDSYSYRIDLSHFEKDKVEIEVKDRFFTISAQQKSSSENSTENFSSSRRSFGAFTRTFTLPADADSSQLSTDNVDGIFLIKIPKK